MPLHHVLIAFAVLMSPIAVLAWVDYYVKRYSPQDYDEILEYWNVNHARTTRKIK